MQDNACFQISNEMKNWFEEENFSLLDYSPISPDFNPTKNDWTELVRMVYGNGQQYASITELRAFIT